MKKKSNVIKILLWVGVFTVFYPNTMSLAKKDEPEEEKKTVELNKAIKRYPNAALLFVDSDGGKKDSPSAKTAKYFLDASTEDLYKNAGLVFIIVDKAKRSNEELSDEFNVSFTKFPVVVLFQLGKPVKKGKQVAQLINPSSKKEIIDFINDRLEDDLKDEAEQVKKYAKEADESEDIDEKTVVNNYYYYNYEDNSYQMYNPGIAWPFFWPWGWGWGMGVFWGGGWWGWGHYHYHGRGRGGYYRHGGGGRHGGGHHGGRHGGSGRRSGRGGGERSARMASGSSRRSSGAASRTRSYGGGSRSRSFGGGRRGGFGGRGGGRRR